MTALVEMSYHDRLVALGVQPGQVLETGACVTCGVAMELRVNSRLDDSGWWVVGPVERIDPWQRLDELLAAGDVAAYSAAKAHRGLMGGWPWDHNHLAR